VAPTVLYPQGPNHDFWIMITFYTLLTSLLCIFKILILHYIWEGFYVLKYAGSEVIQKKIFKDFSHWNAHKYM
jgi:hypothetical protein